MVKRPAQWLIDLVTATILLTSRRASPDGVLESVQMKRGLRLPATLMIALAACSVITHAQRGGRGAPQAPPTARASAPFDLTGQWVSLITEDWRHRQFTPPKGDYAALPLSPAGRKTADNWDPARDEAAGEQCKAYGAAGLLRLPTRLRIAWQDDTTLKLETDAGMQTRVFQFGSAQGSGGDWQGLSIASWDYPRAAFAGRGGGSAPGGSLKVITTRMKPGYLRKNGVPYSADAMLTEYFDRFDVPGGDSLLVITTEVVDPEYLATPYWTSQQFKRETDTSRWNPTPCAAR
jgi:hypothetical protein